MSCLFLAFAAHVLGGFGVDLDHFAGFNEEGHHDGGPALEHCGLHAAPFSGVALEARVRGLHGEDHGVGDLEIDHLMGDGKKQGRWAR